MAKKEDIANRKRDNEGAGAHARPPRTRDAAKMADGGDGSPAGREPGPGPGPDPEPGEEFEIVDRSQLPGPSELRSVGRRRAAAEGWSGPILTLARRATGNLSASCGSALRAATGLGGADGGADGTAHAGRSSGRAPPASGRARGSWLWETGWRDPGRRVVRNETHVSTCLTSLFSLHQAGGSGDPHVGWSGVANLTLFPGQHLYSHWWTIRKCASLSLTDPYAF